jgi:hypothetical protein
MAAGGFSELNLLCLVTEAAAAAVRAVFEQEGELSTAIEGYTLII